MIELWFLFSLIWSLGATVDENSRKKFDMFLREIEGQFPRKHTVFEYYVDPIKRGWALWEDKVSFFLFLRRIILFIILNTRFQRNGGTHQIRHFIRSLCQLLTQYEIPTSLTHLSKQINMFCLLVIREQV
jgi:hypothetical protein